MTEPLSDEARKDLYGAMLRGLAQTAQDQLCASDTQHAWGAWKRFAIHHDVIPRIPAANEPIIDMEFKTRAERRCLNCGKEQHD